MEPSILSADYARLGEQVELVTDAGARVLHVDVMDGHFVAPITIGPVVIKAIEQQVHGVGGIFDCHLMVERPDQQVGQFAEVGADSITVQYEASNASRALELAREQGCTTGLAINPGTPAEVVSELLDEIDFVLCMTVDPGWAGQAFIEGSEDKVRRLRELVGPDMPIQVDGGISADNAVAAADAGATLFVAGSHIFGAPDPAESYRAIAAAVGAE